MFLAVISKYVNENKVDLVKLRKKDFQMWVLGGNHSWEAVMKVKEACPEKHFMDKMLIQIWWFESWKDEKTLAAIEMLAAHHNIDQEFRKDWSFVDKLNFLRRKYIRAKFDWSKEVVEEACKALSFQSGKTINPLLQLVSGSKAKWVALNKILTTSKEKINSEAKFRCLQGNLSEEQVVDLLQRVANGVISLEDMAREASELKLDVKIKTAAAQLLKCADFRAVEKKFGLQAFSEDKRRSFYPAFSKFKTIKGRKKAGEAALVEVPESFARYVETVRTMTSGIDEIIKGSLKPYRINNCDHYVFEIDVGNLEKIVSE